MLLCDSVIVFYVYVFYVLTAKMVTTCAAYGCKNRANYGSKVKFHKFPSIQKADLPKKRNLAMNRKEFNPSPTAKVCSDHFTCETRLYAIMISRHTTFSEYFMPLSISSLALNFSGLGERLPNLIPAIAYFALNYMGQTYC